MAGKTKKTEYGWKWLDMVKKWLEMAGIAGFTGHGCKWLE